MVDVVAVVVPVGVGISMRYFVVQYAPNASNPVISILKSTKKKLNKNKIEDETPAR